MVDITKRLAGMPDMNFWDGTIADQTYTALTSTGRTMTLRTLGYRPDYDWVAQFGDIYTKSPWVDVRAFNASGSSTTTTGSISNGTYQLTLADAKDFRNGQGVRVAGAGVAGADLVATIESGEGGVTLTLGTAASTTVVAAAVYHDDSAAIQAASVAGTKSILFPPGTYMITSEVEVASIYTVGDVVLDLVGLSAKITLKGEWAHWDALQITADTTPYPTTIIHLKNRGLCSDFLRITGAAGQGQTGILWATDDGYMTHQVYSNYQTLSVDYPIKVTGARWFNNNRIVSGRFYEFISAFLLTETADGYVNHFKVYCESGTNVIQQTGTGSFYSNTLELWHDLVTNTINTARTWGVGNFWIWNDPLSDFVVAGGGTVEDEKFFGSYGMFVDRLADYIIKTSSGTGWYGMSADHDAADINSHDVALELISTGFNGATQTWRQVGTIAAKFSRQMAFYDTSGSQLVGWFNRNGCWIRETSRVIEFADSPYTLTATDERSVMYCDTTAGAITIYLPDAATANGREFTFIKLINDANIITIDANTIGGDKINGANTNVEVDARYDSMTVIAAQGTWLIKSKIIS